MSYEEQKQPKTSQKILLMEEILHQLIGRLSHCLILFAGFYTSQMVSRISSINRIIFPFIDISYPPYQSNYHPGSTRCWMAGPLPQIPRVFAWETASSIWPRLQTPQRAVEEPTVTPCEESRGPSSLGSASDLTTWRPFFFCWGGGGWGECFRFYEVRIVSARCYC